MKTKEEILDNADCLGLQVVETCDNGAGYPSGISRAVIGFENFEAAKKFATENECEVCLFKIRAGHHFYQNLGWTYRVLTYKDYLNDLGDNYREFDFEQELAAAKENLEYAGGTVQDYEDLMEVFDGFKREVDNLPDDKVLIYNGYKLEQCSSEMMSYSEDVYTYIVGVAVNGDE